MTFIEFQKLFLESMTLSKGTLDIYDTAFKNIIKVVGDMSIEELTALHWEKYKRVRSGNVSPGTTNIELRSLRAAMNRAVDWKLLSSNPFERQKLCMVPESAPTFFSVSDFGRLVLAIRDKWFRSLVIFAVLTGLRRAEIINLRWTDVDFERKTVRVESNADFKTKAGKRRTIALTATAIVILSEIRSAGGTDHIFSFRGKRIRAALLSKKLKRAVKDAMLEDQRLHFHSLRHTFASWLAQKGTSLYEIQKLLGHKNITTSQIYAHLLPSELHETVSQLEGMVPLH
jgi:integrase